MSIGPTRSYGLIIPKADYINSLVRQGTISREAKKRLQWMDHYHKHGNARFTCRYFGISPQTFYRWKNRFDRYDLTTLEEQSRRPHKVRKPESVDEKILDFFPDMKDIANMDDRKRSIRLKDLLTMRSGTDYNENGPDSPHHQLNRLPTGWDKFYLDRPMISDPGTYFLYDSGGVNNI
jgi:transposase